jgi:hypothetical protein
MQARHFLLFLMFGLWSLVLKAQSGSFPYSALDYRLYNGKVYSYYPPSDVIGNQFLNTADFYSGIIWLGGEEHRNIKLNLDILNQQLLLSFHDSQGALKIISVSMAYVDSFYFDQKFFIIKHETDDNVFIYQQIGKGKLRFYIRWYKNLNLRTSMNVIQYEFSKSLRKIYYENADIRIEIRSNRKFRKFFPRNQAAQLHKFMRSRKMKFGKMNDGEFIELLEFIQRLYHE